MAFAALVSAFCSAAEAAFFSLTSQDRTKLRSGRRISQLAASLSMQSDKILPAILLWNLTANLIIFACSTVVVIDLQKKGHGTESGLFALATLFSAIIFCELIPKSLGVTLPRLLAPLLALPLSLLTHVVEPMIPVLERINLLSQRLFCPNLKPEPYLRVSDLERMIDLTPRGKKSTADTEPSATLLKREQQVLRNIVGLSDATAEEMMRPRTRLRLFKPPVTLASLQDGVPPGGYLLITEPDTDEIASAIALDRFTGGHRLSVANQSRDGHGAVELEQPLHDGSDALAYASCSDFGGHGVTALPCVGGMEMIVWDEQSNPVVYVPWRMKASHVLETLQKEKKEVAAVVNEYGETIGILTFDDLVHSIFSLAPSRSARLFKQSPVRSNGEGRCLVSTMTTLRRIARYLHVELPDHEPSTVGGILEELLERFPQEGDHCDWGPFHWHVLARNESGTFDVEITFRTEEDGP